MTPFFKVTFLDWSAKDVCYINNSSDSSLSTDDENNNEEECINIESDETSSEQSVQSEEEESLRFPEGVAEETIYNKIEELNNYEDEGSLPTWQNERLYPPSTRKVKNLSLVWKFGGFKKS